MAVEDEVIFSVLQHQHEERAADAVQMMVNIAVVVSARTHPDGASIVIPMDDITKVNLDYEMNAIMDDGKLVIVYKPREKAVDTDPPTPT